LNDFMLDFLPNSFTHVQFRGRFQCTLFHGDRSACFVPDSGSAPAASFGVINGTSLATGREPFFDGRRLAKASFLYPLGASG
jgi:hypothetical protein